LSPTLKHLFPAGFTPLFHHERLDAPSNTKVPSDAAENPRRKRVFVCSMADLYGRWVPRGWIERCIRRRGAARRRQLSQRICGDRR
jgi:hypothetical protein